MKKNRFFVAAVTLICSFAASQQALAKDDFGKIVKHIEVNYNVHRENRFAFGLAGFVVKFWHVAGVKSFKGAMFENGRLLNAAADNHFDQLMRTAMNSGWQSMVQSYDRRTGERTYIYAQDLGKDMKLLVVNLESNEAVVIQVKVNPDKLSDFVKEAGAGHHHGGVQPGELPVTHEQTIEAGVTAQSWEGVCLMPEAEPAQTIARAAAYKPGI
jgi:hypothetical protein